jgi:hypothetical protein
VESKALPYILINPAEFQQLKFSRLFFIQNNISARIVIPSKRSFVYLHIQRIRKIRLKS